MRFSIGFEWHSTRGIFYLNYHRFILSIVKKSFEKANISLYNKLYIERKNQIKPYTFSVFFPNSQFKKNGIILGNNNEFILNFSTFAADIGITFYNGLIKQLANQLFLEMNYNKDKTILKLKNVILRREHKITTNKVKFKTLSPIIIREHIKDKNKDNYISFEKNSVEEINKILNVNMYSVFKEYLNKNYDLKLSLIDNKKLKPVYIKMGRSGIIGNIGKFILEGDIKALDFVYKAGLGARRSFGFGMLEVVNEEKE